MNAPTARPVAISRGAFGCSRSSRQARLGLNHVAHCRHEQVQGRMRPLFVDKMKKKLIHESFKL